MIWNKINMYVCILNFLSRAPGRGRRERSRSKVSMSSILFLTSLEICKVDMQGMTFDEENNFTSADTIVSPSSETSDSCLIFADFKN